MCWSKHSGALLLCNWAEVLVCVHASFYISCFTCLTLDFWSCGCLSLLITNTEVRFFLHNSLLLSCSLWRKNRHDDSFADATQWVIRGAVSVELNKLNKQKPNPVFDNQPLYKSDNEVKGRLREKTLGSVLWIHLHLFTEASFCA